VYILVALKTSRAQYSASLEWLARSAVSYREKVRQNCKLLMHMSFLSSNYRYKVTDTLLS